MSFMGVVQPCFKLMNEIPRIFHYIFNCLVTLKRFSESFIIQSQGVTLTTTEVQGTVSVVFCGVQIQRKQIYLPPNLQLTVLVYLKA